MPIIRRISRHGPSAQITIPPQVLDYLDLRRGDYVAWVFAPDGTVIFDKVTPKKFPSLYEIGLNEIDDNDAK